MHSTDNAFITLHDAGWSLGELCYHTPHGPRWHVSACRNGVAVRGEGATETEAWQACLEAARNVKGKDG